MTNTEGLLLDENGIPILTDIVRDGEEPEPAEGSRSEETSILG